jgi:protein-disulfide isomerase
VAAGVIVLATVGIVLGVVLTGSSKSDAVPKDALPHAAQVQQMLNGIQQDKNMLGSPSAPATMVEYLDVQCPYCRDFATSALPKLIARYVRTGKLRIDVRPITGVGPDSQTGRLALIAAGEEGKFFNLLELFYFNQGTENGGWLNENLVRSAAESIPGLDASRLVEVLKSSAATTAANAFDTQAIADNIKVSPTILVGKTGGKLSQVTLVSSVDEHTVPAAIDAALR